MVDIAKFKEALEKVGKLDLTENLNDIRKLISDKYTELMKLTIDSASKHLEKTNKELKDFSHILPLLFDRAKSSQGRNK